MATFSLFPLSLLPPVSREHSQLSPSFSNLHFHWHQRLFSVEPRAQTLSDTETCFLGQRSARLKAFFFFFPQKLKLPYAHVSNRRDRKRLLQGHQGPKNNWTRSSTMNFPHSTIFWWHMYNEKALLIIGTIKGWFDETSEPPTFIYFLMPWK